LKARTGNGLMPVLPLRDAVYFPGLPNTLHVARDQSLIALRRSLDGDRRVLVISQRDMAVDEPGPSDLHSVGTVCEVLHALPLPDQSLRVSLRGLHRVRACQMSLKGRALVASYDVEPESVSHGPAIEALMRECVSQFAKIAEMTRGIPVEAVQSVAQIGNPGLLADSIAHHALIRPAQKQALLEEFDVQRRLEVLFEALKLEAEVLDLGQTINRKVESELADGQREFYLREQLKAIQGELQIRENRVGEVDEYLLKIETIGMPADIKAKAETEVRRLDRASASSPEGQVIRAYLDCLLSIPWNVSTEDRLDVQAASDLLDRDHFGLKPVKERILEHLAVRRLRNSLQGSILCFVGPPGVGKTSIARSVASAMGRKYARVSVGGLIDEAELRGHRRTYVGARPGRIVNSLIQCGSRNPVIVLDEIDKMGLSSHADPAAVLLELFDSEQNSAFVDHYLEVPIDLSTVLFIATANSLHSMSSALRDRLEIVPFSGYTTREKVRIARDYVLPKSLADHGLSNSSVVADDSALELVINEYTRESGARQMRRQIDSISRRLARKVVEGATGRLKIDVSAVRQYLGPAMLPSSEDDGPLEAGIAMGLAVGEAGGDVLPVEVALLPAFSANHELRLTGSLGDIMKESAEAALTYVRGSWSTELAGSDIHIHVPLGTVPKDGPSAGIAIAAALASCASGVVLPQGWAMTGEISVRGRVLAVGGLREKLLAALREGITDVIIPKGNLGDVEELPSEVTEGVTLHPVATVAQAFELLGLSRRS
jgi:ATP-dependent Lon protease